MLCIHFYPDPFWSSLEYLKFEIVVVIYKLNSSEHQCNFISIPHQDFFLPVRISSRTALLSLLSAPVAILEQRFAWTEFYRHKDAWY